MPPVYEALLLNTVVPQIQAAQAGDSYVMVVNATTPALRITQTGTGNALEVEDSANPDATPFVVTAAGDVGIGTSSPSTYNAKLVSYGSFGTSTPAFSLVNASAENASNIAESQYWLANSFSGLVNVAKIGAISGTTGNQYGSLYFSTSNAGAPTERMRLDAAGNLGLGVTPSAWSGIGQTLQVNTGGSFSADAANAYFAANSYYNGTNWIYQTTNNATRYTMAANSHLWYTAPSGTAGNAIPFTQAMTLDADGNLGVGATSVSSHISGSARVLGICDSQFINLASVRLSSGSTLSSGNRMEVYSAGSVCGLYGQDSSPMLFSTNATERARITSGGYFKASNTGTYNNSTGSFHELYQTSSSEPAVVVTIQNASYVGNGLFVEAARNTTNNSFYAINYYNSGAGAFKFRVADSGDVTNTNGTYGTISDQKMKTDIVDAGSQWSDIKALRFRKFKMKDDPSGLVQLGVVAQEVELTSPGLVDEHQDRDAEGNDLGTTTKSVKTSVLLMKAAVALQEAMARIETLEAKIAALEAK